MLVSKRNWSVTLRSPSVVDVTSAVNKDLLDEIFSPILNLFWFNKTIPTEVTFGFSTTNPTALLSKPTICSPIIKSELLPLGPSYAVKTTVGKSGSPASLDSITANNLHASGTFKDILSSWTLVPNIELVVNPSFKLFVPIPEESKVDLLTTTTFASFNFLSLFNLKIWVFLKV